jgi:hypothetical protein
VEDVRVRDGERWNWSILWHKNLFEWEWEWELLNKLVRLLEAVGYGDYFDKWLRRMTSDGKFSVKSSYGMLEALMTYCCWKVVRVMWRIE